MIVDVHTHVPRTFGGTRTDMAPMRPDQPNPTGVTEADYIRAMGPAEVAICFNIAAPPPGDDSPAAGLRQSAREVNDSTAEFVAKHPDRLIGFLTVHPRQPDVLEEIERSVGDLGLKGIKLGPNYQNFDPLGEDAFRIYRRAEELGLPILFHQGTSPVRHADLDYAHPRHMDRVATAFPELRVVMAHMGHPWWIDTITVIRKHPNVWADISALFYRPWSQWECFRYATEWSVLHKMLFGTDFPVATVEETIAGTRRVNEPIAGTSLPRVPEEEIEKIIHRDSLAMLGLERPRAVVAR
jgi:predicted TIM-barrel fold metal-dependent hydrolase